MNVRLQISCFLLILLLISCSLEYSDSVTDSLDASVPASLLYNVKRVQVNNGSPKVSFEADKAVIWDRREETELFNFDFTEYDSVLNVITKGQADYLLISDSYDASIEGNISGYSHQNEISIEAETLEWKDNTRELSSPQESRVIINMDEGSVLKGLGFKADFFTRSIEFDNGIEGELETGADSEN